MRNVQRSTDRPHAYRTATVRNPHAGKVKHLMWRIYNCVVYDHDQRFVVLALIICVLGAFTASMVVQRSIETTRWQRLRWVIFAGAVTGIFIWTTHFTAMLGFAPAVEMHFNVSTAAVSILTCILLSTLGWLLAMGSGAARPLLGGMLVGVGLAVAHFLDMAAIRFGGVVQYDHDLVIVAVAGGVGLCALAGWLLVRDRTTIGFASAAGTLAVSVLFLHFVAMASVTLVPTGGSVQDNGLLDLNGLGIAVVAASMLMIASALAVAYHSNRVALVTTQERANLLEALAALRQSEEHHRAFVELSPQIHYVTKPNGAVTELGPLWAELVGASLAEGLGEGWMRFVHPDDIRVVGKAWETALATARGDIADARYRLRLRDGSYRWFRARAQPRLDGAGTGPRLVRRPGGHPRSGRCRTGAARERGALSAGVAGDQRRHLGLVHRDR
jgi:PAS domain S-box-containing protein